MKTKISLFAIAGLFLLAVAGGGCDGEYYDSDLDQVVNEGITEDQGEIDSVAEETETDDPAALSLSGGSSLYGGTLDGVEPCPPCVCVPECPSESTCTPRTRGCRCSCQTVTAITFK